MGSLYRRGKTWYAKYTDAAGKVVRRSTGTRNKRDAETILASMERDANLLRHNAHGAATDLETLLNDYLDYLGATSGKHRAHTEARLRAIIEPNDWLRPEQINQYQLETTVRQLTDKRTGELLALRTQHHYLTAAKGFTRWLVNVRRVLASDPLSGVRKPRFDRDRRRVRRYLTPEEWFWLAKTPRATLYETAIQTGLRARELFAIRPEYLRADHIYVPGRYTKNHNDARQYITADLHARLQRELPFRVPNIQRTAAMLKRDLELALSMYRDQGPTNAPDGFLAALDPRGEVLDFHALRHTCGAWLALRGVSPKVIQTVMRHASIRMTLDVYGHLWPGAERDAVGNFETLLATS